MNPTATAKKESGIPQRKDIEEKHKWDLRAIYADDSVWEKAFKKVLELIEKASQFKGKLHESPGKLYDCLVTRTELFKICSDLYQYAKLNQDLDTRVSRYQEMTDRAAMINSKANAAYSYVEPELMKISDDKLIEMSGNFPDKNLYDFYIRELIRSRKHIRSEEIEEILAQASVIARGADNIFTMLDDADIKYPTITDDKGEEIQLTKQRYAKLMEHPVQEIRRKAHEAFMSAYRDHINTLGASLSASLNKDLFYARARNYESSLHDALDDHNIPSKVYHSLIETTEKNIGGFHKWMGLRKKILKLDKLYPYDVYCPLFPELNYEVSYDDAVSQVLEAVAPLGQKYQAKMKEAFENRWVDVYETEGKTGGAYNWGNYSTHPFILMNYNDTINNMFTLAHEMGHAMHSFLSNRTQPFTKAHYSIFVAEVASTLNEGLLLNYLLKQTDDKKRKLFLLNRQIDNTLGTFFHQVFFADFEHQVHELVRNGEALSAERAGNLWEDLNRKYYGPDVTLDEYSKYKWARIPHFYMTYYVYQYATSFAASQAILAKFLDGEEGIIEKYLILLSSGGNDYPIEQLKKCGVDMTEPRPFEDTIRLFDRQIDEVGQLVD